MARGGGGGGEGETGSDVSGPRSPASTAETHRVGGLHWPSAPPCVTENLPGGVHVSV